ncbi:MAG: hypothetical protein QUS09_11015 [Methanotrichaceae archaeon]|nr:hypothetical protein [Methanotrichaceae archaeon]
MAHSEAVQIEVLMMDVRLKLAVQLEAPAQVEFPAQKDMSLADLMDKADMADFPGRDIQAGTMGIASHQALAESHSLLLQHKLPMMLRLLSSLSHQKRSLSHFITPIPASR